MAETNYPQPEADPEIGHITPRMPGEGNRPFEAFVSYRDLGPDRSLFAVSQKLSKSIAIVSRWSRAYRWVERVTAYDDAMDRVRIRALAAEAYRDAGRWESRKRASLERAFRNSERLSEVAESMLLAPVLEEQIGPDGGAQLRQIGKWVMRDAAAFLKTSVEIQQAIFQAVDQSMTEGGLTEGQLRAMAGLDERVEPEDI